MNEKIIKNDEDDLKKYQMKLKYKKILLIH